MNIINQLIIVNGDFKGNTLHILTIKTYIALEYPVFVPVLYRFGLAQCQASTWNIRPYKGTLVAILDGENATLTANYHSLPFKSNGD